LARFGSVFEPHYCNSHQINNFENCFLERGLARQVHFPSGMMLSLIESPKHNPMPCCTREEAARLLEALRAEYQRLSPEVRGAVKAHLSRLADAQFSIEGEET
jgi:hypothetical protein